MIRSIHKKIPWKYHCWERQKTETNAEKVLTENLEKMPSDKPGCMNFHRRIHMTVQMLVKTIWFAVFLYLFSSLVPEDVLPLMAECSWIYSLTFIFPDF